MASPARRTWVWISSRSWWWTGTPGMLQSMGSKRVGPDWATELTEHLHWETMKQSLSPKWRYKEAEVCAQSMSDSLRPHGLHPTRLLCAWNFPGKSIGVGCCFLLQGIFLTLGSNPHLFASLVLEDTFFTTVPCERTVFQNNKTTNSFWSEMVQRLTNKVLLNSTRNSA